MEISTTNLKSLNVKDNELIKDGVNIDINLKELGISEIYPIV
jgi:hypothetical protein